MSMTRASVRELVRDEMETLFRDKLTGLLEDVSYRLKTLYDAMDRHALVNSRDLYLTRHLLEGYTVSDDSPTAGKIAWNDLAIVYKGTTYQIASGNTDKKYAYWDFSAADKTVLTCTDTKPELGEDDLLVFVNEDGKHATVVGQMLSGAVLLDGTISSNEVGTGAISALKLATGAVTGDKIASGAVVAGALATGAVTGDKIASGAVGATAIAMGAVGSTALAANAVTDGKIAANAVGSAALAANAVTDGKIASGAVGSTALASGAVTDGKIAAGAVGTAAIAANAITGNKIQGGAIAADKLNTARHMIF